MIQTIVFAHAGAWPIVERNAPKWPVELPPFLCLPARDEHCPTPTRLPGFTSCYRGRDAYSGDLLWQRWLASLAAIPLDDRTSSVLLMEYDTIWVGEQPVHPGPGKLVTADYLHPIPAHRTKRNYYSPWWFDMVDYRRFLVMAEQVGYIHELHDFTDFWMQDIVDRLGLETVGPACHTGWDASVTTGFIHPVKKVLPRMELLALNKASPIDPYYEHWLKLRSEGVGCTLFEYRVLYSIAHNLQPRNILEIGCGSGASSVALLLGSGDRASLHRVTIHPEQADDVVDPIFSPQISTWAMTSDAFFAEIKPAVGTYDIIFIDGDHSQEVVERDIRQSLRVLTQGGVIVLHDTKPTCMGDIGTLARRLAVEAGYQYDELPTDGNGLGAISQ